MLLKPTTHLKSINIWKKTTNTNLWIQYHQLLHDMIGAKFPLIHMTTRNISVTPCVCGLLVISFIFLAM